jgi:hypothetical protein
MTTGRVPAERSPRTRRVSVNEQNSSSRPHTTSLNPEEASAI